MKHTPTFTVTRRGFTLVELLVVISIIAVLAALGFKGFTMAREMAMKTKATTCISQLVQASEDFYNEYSQLPLGATNTTDAEVKTDNQLMAPLVGLKSAIDENPKEEAFFKFQKAQGKGNDEYDGLARDQNRAELFGPWKNREKTDRYYIGVFNYDYDNILREPNALGNEQHYETKVLFYHKGKDGKVGGKNNKDNVYSWPKKN